MRPAPTRRIGREMWDYKPRILWAAEHHGGADRWPSSPGKPFANARCLSKYLGRR